MPAGWPPAAISFPASVSSSAADIRPCSIAATPLDYELLGTTRDDAAGEAFDKVAAILGLGFPGGPAVEREAAGGDPDGDQVSAVVARTRSPRFQFSGLKTAVLYAVQGQDRSQPRPAPTGQRRAGVAASFQQAVIDVLVEKARLALRQTGLTRLAVGGGVSANAALRTALTDMCAANGAELFIPPQDLCTDNAAMAALAVEKWKRGELRALDLDAEPGLQSSRQQTASSGQ